MPRRLAVGIVVSDRMSKTRRVEIRRLVRHPKYGKFMRRRTVCHVHDEEETSRRGDTVEIVESRPLSRLKRWQLVRVVSKGRLVDLAARRAELRAREQEAMAAMAGDDAAVAEEPGDSPQAPDDPT